ncbi:MAG: hypothetical protein IJZ21_01990, partial [Clostridia bacterium]|nr:hypothetical protein [Clostridia bacterium]
MKKLVCIILAFCILSTLCACGKTNTKESTITASNGDKIDITLQSGKNPSVLVKVNGKEIYYYNNYQKHKDAYDFEEDFTDEVIAECSDDKILWAYRFDWGIIYSTKYSLSDGTEKTITYVCPKHDYKKSYFKNICYNILAEKWDLIDFEIIPQTGDKIFWDSYTATQVIFEDLYKTENYTLKEIDNLEKAGYSFEDYNDMHQLEFGSGSGLNQWKKIYEVSVKGKPFALIYSDTSTANFSFQELDWQYA